MTGWQVGDKMTMFFYVGGATSSELLTVMEITDTEVALDDIFDDEEGNEQYRRFDRKTGNCLNDNTTFGARRYVKRCWAATK